MEAYLKGCGDSMVKQFEDQVEMQTTLEKIGLEVCVCVCVDNLTCVYITTVYHLLQLKQRCNDEHSKMQAMLPEMLENSGIPEFVLTPVYNPR